jgi:hypothetical protein
MNNNFILKDDGWYWIQKMHFEPTDNDNYEERIFNRQQYEKDLASAIRDAVRVSNQGELKFRMHNALSNGRTDVVYNYNHPYSLQCSVRKYYTAKSDNRTIEEMMAGVTLTEKPLTDGVLKSVLVTFPESGNKTEQEQEQTADQMLAAAVKRHNTNGFPATTYEEDYAGGSEMYVQESIALDAIRQLQQQVNSLREQMATHDKCDEIDWNWNPKTVALKEENERLKADIKTIGQILKDGGWIDLFEKIIALNPTPKTEGTSI